METDLKEFTVVGVYHDNDQAYTGHILATDPKDAEKRIQQQLEEEMFEANEDNDEAEADYVSLKELSHLPEIEVPEPDHIRVIAVLAGFHDDLACKFLD